jgi:hypothetical protein
MACFSEILKTNIHYSLNVLWRIFFICYTVLYPYPPRRFLLVHIQAIALTRTIIIVFASMTFEAVICTR